MTRDLQPDIEALYEKYVQDPDSRIFAPLADAYRKSGLLDEAIDICEKGLKKYPNYSSAYVILAKCFYDQGSTDQAQETFEKVIEIDPENMVALKFMGDILRAKGEEKAALDFYLRVLSLDPFNETVRNIVDEMTTVRSIEADIPDVEDPHLHVADDVDPERSPAGEERKSDPEPIPLGDARDGAYSSTDRDEDLDFEEAIEIEGDEPRLEDRVVEEQESPFEEMATLTLAGIYAAQGYRKKALKIYRDILDKDPANQEVQALIHRLESEEAEAEGRVAPPPAPAREPASAEGTDPESLTLEDTTASEEFDETPLERRALESREISIEYPEDGEKIASSHPTEKPVTPSRTESEPEPERVPHDEEPAKQEDAVLSISPKGISTALDTEDTPGTLDDGPESLEEKLEKNDKDFVRFQRWLKDLND